MLPFFQIKQLTVFGKKIVADFLRQAWQREIPDAATKHQKNFIDAFWKRQQLHWRQWSFWVRHFGLPQIVAPDEGRGWLA